MVFHTLSWGGKKGKYEREEKEGKKEIAQS